MTNKLIVQSIINKYYLGLNESVKWVIEDSTLNIDFMTPTKDVIGSVSCDNFDLEDCKLAIYDTKKLQNLISICSGELLLELTKNNVLNTKLKISDLNFNLTYALSDPLLIGKVGTVNDAEWVVEVNLETEDVSNLIITTTTNLDNENVVEFVFGDESGHNNKIAYQMPGVIKEENMNLPFNSDTLKTILQANKDMGGGKLYLSSMGLMKLEFSNEGISSVYFMVRRSESEF